MLPLDSRDCDVFRYQEQCFKSGLVRQLFRIYIFMVLGVKKVDTEVSVVEYLTMYFFLDECICFVDYVSIDK